MARLKIGFILKLGGFIIFLLLMGPYIFHLKLSKEVSNTAEVNRLEKNIISDPVELNDVELTVLSETELGNFEPEERLSLGRPGDNGERVILHGKEKAQAPSSLAEYGFNKIASDKVPMDRIVPEMRHPECKHWHYPRDQPKASVVLVFHNEMFSTLVRTVHSVINTSPPQLLEEVVLVDDFSQHDDLKEQLETYIKQFNGKVKLYRNSEREGLIRTRTRGAELSIGDVVVFLDAHCECNRNWLVPLLDVIRQDRTTMAVPIIDGIDHNTFSYRPVYDYHSNFRGIFEWGFLYKENAVPERELNRRKHESEPYRSPTHAGGLFAIDRKYFNELGGYDPQLAIWGGENYELSFKIWQCGGKIVWVPCSRVGHIYRNHMPYGFGNKHVGKISPIKMNYLRVVEVWLDPEFKEFFYTREPTLRGYPVGDIKSQLDFKREHKCRNFTWFMENIAYDVYDQFPKLPANKAWGHVENQQTHQCWTKGWGDVREALTLSPCYPSASNIFRLNERGQIGIGERCIVSKDGKTLITDYCSRDPAGPWKFDSGQIYNVDHDKCVGAGEEGGELRLRSCEVETPYLMWEFKEYYEKDR